MNKFLLSISINLEICSCTEWTEYIKMTFGLSADKKEVFFHAVEF